MYTEAKKYCLGILRGIYKFEKNATTDFAEWAVDAPHNYFEVVFEKWKKKHKEKDDIKELKDIIKKELNDW